MQEHHEVLVVGGGNAGISLAARLLRDGAGDVAVVSPQPVHRYRPLLNYVGAGEASMSAVDRPAEQVVPPGCTWVRDGVVAVDARAGTARTRGGRTLGWTSLVLCPGMVEDWEAVPGLREAYLDGWAVSTYVPGAVEAVWPRVRTLRRGRVLFSVPPEPAPCAPTALKPLFMACDHWRRRGVLRDLEVHLVLPEATATGVGAADRRIERALRHYGVHVVREAQLAEVDPDRRAVTVSTAAGPVVLDDVDLAHAVPHYRAPQWVADSGLAAERAPGRAGTAPGLVDVDPTTLRHRRHPSVWALGDAADLRTRSSGGALRKQVPVLAHNLAAARDGGRLRHYDGSTVMPITLGRHRLLIAEADRSGKVPVSARLLGLARPRRATWFFDRYVLPQVYWHRLLRGNV